MGSGFSKMKKQARQMEQQMEIMKEELKNKTFVGSSGHGLVTITLDGEKSVKDLKIKPECVDPTDVEGLEDLIKEAFKDALAKIESEGSQLGIPSGLPFSF